MYVRMYRTEHLYIAVDDADHIAPCTVTNGVPPYNWTTPDLFQGLLQAGMVFWVEKKYPAYQNYNDSLLESDRKLLWEAYFPHAEPRLTV